MKFFGPHRPERALLRRNTLYYSKRIIIVRWADLSDFFSLIFVGIMCVFVSRPMKIVTFLRKNGETPKRVVDFPRERNTIRNKIMEIVEDFACESNFFIFLPFFHHFSSIFLFSFFLFFIFSSFFHFSFFFFFFIFPSKEPPSQKISFFLLKSKF